MTCHCWLEDDRMSHVKEVGTSVLQPQGIDSANNLNEPISGISPEIPDKIRYLGDKIPDKSLG